MVLAIFVWGVRRARQHVVPVEDVLIVGACLYELHGRLLQLLVLLLEPLGGLY